MSCSAALNHIQATRYLVKKERTETLISSLVISKIREFLLMRRQLSESAILRLIVDLRGGSKTFYLKDIHSPQECEHAAEIAQQRKWGELSGLTLIDFEKCMEPMFSNKHSKFLNMPFRLSHYNKAKTWLHIAQLNRTNSRDCANLHRP